MHPEQYYEGIQNYAALQNKALSGELPIWNILERWASVFTAVTVIVNRETPLHRDTMSRDKWFDILTSCGTYDDAALTLPSLEMTLKYEAGVMVGISGKVVRHGVRCASGTRICLTWYTKEAVHAYTKTRRGGWSTLGVAKYDDEWYGKWRSVWDGWL